jgi:hypothetical protein
MIYLYVKTHQLTGMKYLGMTRQDPYSYSGSGTYWRKHLKKRGNNISTEILLATENENEIAETGLFFSKLWNIVESTEWANLVPEEGEGGKNLRHLKRTPEWNRKVGEASKGRPPANKGKTVWNNGIRNVWSDDRPGPNFQMGILRPSHPGKTIGSTGMTWFTDGTKNILCHDCPDGFRKGRVFTKESKLKGKSSGCRWWNDGKQNKLSKKSPGIEWSLGRLKWIH